MPAARLIAYQRARAALVRSGRVAAAFFLMVAAMRLKPFFLDRRFTDAPPPTLELTAVSDGLSEGEGERSSTAGRARPGEHDRADSDGTRGTPRRSAASAREERGERIQERGGRSGEREERGEGGAAGS